MENLHDFSFENVQFSKAFDATGRIIDIVDIKNQLVSKNQEFTCVGCDKKLRPRTGEIRAAHFFHYKSEACSYETYLHKLGKQLFFNEFQNRKRESKTFAIGIPEKIICTKYQSFERTCTTRSNDSGRVNLIEMYPEIKMEKRSGEFIPDLLVYNPILNTCIFIEIVVSNAPSTEKLESGNPIIQINATSEEDFEFLKKGFISESIINVTLHNFKESQTIQSECESNCQIHAADKNYFETLLWIKDSFYQHKTKNAPFTIKFPRHFSCSRFLEKFETQCQYHVSKAVEIISIYDSAQIISVKGSVCLTISHIQDRTKDILIIGLNSPKPSDWEGAVIRINDLNISPARRRSFLNCLSSDNGEFQLEKSNKGITAKDCTGECHQKHQFFCIRKNMGAEMPEMCLTDNRLHNDNFAFIRMLDPKMVTDNKEQMFFEMVEECLKEGIPVRNCYICRYHGLNNRDKEDSNGPIFCKTFKKSCHSNEAVDCERYRADLASVSQNYQGRQRFYFRNEYGRNIGWYRRDNFISRDNGQYTPFTFIE